MSAVRKGIALSEGLFRDDARERIRAELARGSEFTQSARARVRDVRAAESCGGELLREVLDRRATSRAGGATTPRFRRVLTRELRMDGDSGRVSIAVRVDVRAWASK